LPGAPHIRFYAGVPVRANGYPVGTLCVFDPSPREADPEDLQMLADLAGLVETELARCHDALVDGLTGLLNRRALKAISRVVLALAAHDRKEVAVALTDAARLLCGAFRDSDAVARLSGDESCVLLVSGEDGVDVAIRH
jgi:GAF domain-containing protein